MATWRCADSRSSRVIDVSIEGIHTWTIQWVSNRVNRDPYGWSIEHPDRIVLVDVPMSCAATTQEEEATASDQRLSMSEALTAGRDGVCVAEPGRELSQHTALLQVALDSFHISMSFIHEMASNSHCGGGSVPQNIGRKIEKSCSSASSSQGCYPRWGGASEHPPHSAPHDPSRGSSGIPPSPVARLRDPPVVICGVVTSS